MSVVEKEQRARTPLKQAIQRFLRYSGRFAETTQKQYRDALWRFCDAMPEYIELITPEHIDRHIDSRKILNSSKNTLLIPIKSFFTYLHEYHGFKNVARRVKNLPALPPRQRVISDVEYSKLLEVCKPKERAVIKFLANTGLRAQEFSDLTTNGISPDRKYITVIGKGGKRRIVPLNNTCRECLSLIFTKKHTRDSLYQTCKKLSRKTAMPRFGPHALRHYFCTQLIKKGVPIAIVSKIMGHSSPVITMSVYCHLLVPDFVGATDVLDG